MSPRALSCSFVPCRIPIPGPTLLRELAILSDPNVEFPQRLKLAQITPFCYSTQIQFVSHQISSEALVNLQPNCWVEHTGDSQLFREPATLVPCEFASPETKPPPFPEAR